LSDTQDTVGEGESLHFRGNGSLHFLLGLNLPWVGSSDASKRLLHLGTKQHVDTPDHTGEEPEYSQHDGDDTDRRQGAGSASCEFWQFSRAVWVNVGERI
jgi:hypothetical protein